MIAANKLLEELVTALRNVIAPAIADPYPKSQAYMAAVILEFISRQVEERRDLPNAKAQTLDSLFTDLGSLLAGKDPSPDDPDQEARLCRLIEWSYAEKEHLGPEAFASINQRIRVTLRQLLDQELKIAGTKE